MAGIALFIRERHVDGLPFQGFPGLFMAVVAKCPVLCEKETGVFRGMGGMTGEAPLPLVHRGVRLQDLFLFLFMAFQTETVPFAFQEKRSLRCVGVVAGNTFPLLEGFMLNISRLQLRGFVALIAKCTPLFRDTKRIRRCGRVMTIAAISRDNRTVSACFQ